MLSIDRIQKLCLEVPDFRRTANGNIRHKLGDILTLMILARPCGHTSRADIIEFGKFNLKRLRKIGMLEDRLGSAVAVQNERAV